MWWRKQPEATESKAELRQQLREAIARVEHELEARRGPPGLPRAPRPRWSDANVDQYRALTDELNDELAQLKDALTSLGPD